MTSLDPAWHYRAHDVAQLAQLEAMGWVRCTAAEARECWPGDDLQKAGLVAMKRRRALP